MSNISSILVVGAGQAAAVAAASLRDLGYTGAITLVGDELHPPYERPPLSKAVLAAGADEEPALHIKDAEFFSNGDIDLRLGLRVTQLDVGNRQAVLSDGAQLSFDRCLLATGGVARTLPSLPAQSPFVHYLRTLDDARRLRGCMDRSKHVVIVGGGFLGLEVASTAVGLGAKVSIIESADRVLARVVPPEFSGWLQGRAARSGAALHLGQSIQDVDLSGGDSGMAVISLADGTVLQADTILVAIGLTANNSLARAAGLDVDETNGGVLVDEQCRSSAPGIYAAGDCTSQKRNGQSTALRLESWQNANEQARIAAAAILGQPSKPAAFPWFWTDQFDCNIQMLGLPQAQCEYIVRGEPEPDQGAPSFIMLGLRDGKACQALAVNAGGELRAIRPLLEGALPIDITQFTNTAIALRAYAKAAVAAAKEPGC
ncbi:NAD(P)/FAD-dependent oxidoreductase [Pusillimonas sp.]|uniref:NAD(P)/FAD-dependent oxidoreductase n=1 Tax=Pusillimonas sp. TaxID=3040095 RepID=UPI0037C7BEC6